MNIKLKLICFLLIIPFLSIKAQLNVDDILVDDNKLPKILLVGTFHFAYYDEDTHKTDKNKRIEILSESRQNEIQELIEYISVFKPNKIFVEDFNHDNILMTNYRNYKIGKYELTADEIDQLAFRLMKRFNLDTIYGVDKKTIFNELYNNPDTKSYAQDLDEELDFQKGFLESDIGKRYMKLYDMEDSFLYENTILDYFKILNSQTNQNRAFYSMFAGNLGDENSNVADGLTLSSISRNMRTLNHIESNIDSSEDRVLILFGSSHTSFFKKYYESSPEHELIEFNDLSNFSE